MDPNILSIILGLITNGLTSLIAISAQEAGQLLIGKEFQEKWELEKTSLEPLLNAAIKSVAENVEWKRRPREEVVSLFLLSPEVEEIVRQIYSTRFARGKKRDKLTSIRRIFLTSFTQFVTSYSPGIEVKEDQLAEPADILFNALIKECDLVLESATDKGILAAHEAKSALRHHVIKSDLEAIQKKFDFLLEQKKLDLRAIRDFEKKYRSQVGSSHNSITPPNFDSARKLPINSLFVPPRICTIAKKKEEPKYLNMDDFLCRVYRVVLLGNPGGGKSTFSHKLCHDLATQYPHLVFAGRRHLTPILVVLREYGADKKDRKCSILEFIEAEAKATYQLATPPSHTFEYLLLNGRVMVIFDGLDELLDTSYRQEIRNDVEAFCRLYPAVPVLVTSREVGYEQAPLEETMFEAFRLAEFEDKQVQDYVKKWFNAEDTEVTNKQRQEKIETFLEESRIVPDLRSNPLMLALLCNIYKGENYIPRNRPEVYDKCATMLFERWDKSRNLYAPPLLEEHMRPLMEYLAQWIFADEVLRKGVTESELVAKATEYLFEWVFESINKAERVAREFIEFCTAGRAWVFLDTGTQKEGEKLYQFAHTTFLEYFTAAYLVRTYRTPDELIEELHPRIAKREWDMVAQLAFQLQSKRMSGAGDELLTALISVNDQVNSDESNLLSFAVRCLEFMTPRPKVARSIAEACIECIIRWETHKRIKSLEEQPQRRVRGGMRNHEIFRSLLAALSSNYEVITDTLEKQLIERINMGSEDDALLNLDLLSCLSLPGFLVFDEEKLRGIYRMSDLIISSCMDRFLELSAEHFDACFQATRLGIVKVTDLIKWHGINSLFRANEISIFPVLFGTIHTDILLPILLSTPYSFHEWPRIFRSRLDNLKEIGRFILSSSDPCFEMKATRPEKSIIYYFDPTLFKRFPNDAELQSLDSEAWFGGFVLLALYFELNETKLIEKIEASSHPFLKFIGQILFARLRPIPLQQVQSQLDKCGLSVKQQSFVWKWVRVEIDLVQPAKTKSSKEQQSI